MTSTEGRELIRQQVKHVKDYWEALHDGIQELQREMELSLMNWATFDDSFKQLSDCFKSAEEQLEVNCIPRSSLDDNKAQLHTYKVGMYL